MGYDFAITGVPEKSKDFLGKRSNSEMSDFVFTRKQTICSL